MSTRRVAGRTSPPRPRNGQTLVEFALVLPIFLVMFFGLIDVGRLVYMNSTLSQAAREGARLAAVEASWIGKSATWPSCGQPGGPVCPTDADELRDHVVAAANRMVKPFGTVTTGAVSLRCDPVGSPPSGNWADARATCVGSQIGEIVSVRVQLTFTPITPIAGSVIGSVTTSGFATMVIN
jgi:hypothetical protein